MAEKTRYKLTDLLHEALRRGASDLHLLADHPPVFRIDGELTSATTPPVSASEVKELSCSILSAAQAKRFELLRELDIGYALKDAARFRINLRWQRGNVSMTARVIPKVIPKAEEIGMNEVMYGLTHLVDGLILVTGPAGSGKSTTLATMVDIINTERSAHIITVEDPVEFIHVSKKSIVEQREVGTDTRSFANAVKYSLRQDPDVVLVGEMRDLATVQAVLTAAETGHLVLSTLHTRSARESIERILDIFPPHHQNQVRVQLANVLRAIVSQALLPAVHGGRVVARELLLVTHPVTNLIRDSEMAQIPSHMQMAQREGMQLMESAVAELYRDGKISQVVARNRLGKEYGSHRYY